MEHTEKQNTTPEEVKQQEEQNTSKDQQEKENLVAENTEETKKTESNSPQEEEVEQKQAIDNGDPGKEKEKSPTGNSNVESEKKQEEQKQEVAEQTKEQPAKEPKVKEEEKTEAKEREEKKEKKEEEEEQIPDPEYFNALEREKLVELLQEYVQNDDINKIKRQVGLVKAAFRNKTLHHKQEIYNEFINKGGSVEGYQEPKDELEEQFNASFDIYKKKKAKFIEEQEKQKIENLQFKNDILEELRKLIESDEELKTTYDAFKDLQDKWKEIGPVPQKERNNLWQNYHFLVEKFFDKVKINKELKDLDLKKNLQKKIELCEKAEELLLESSIKKSFQLLQKYHDEYREIGPVPKEKKDEIWERFSAATKKIHERRREYYNDLREQQKENYEAKASLCEKVEAINEEEINSPKLWQQKTNEILEIQKNWRTIGFAPRNVNDEIWNRFRTAQNVFFKNKKEFFKKLKDEQKENYNLKLNICVQAEGIQDSTDWKKTTNDLINLQKEWKKIGPVPRKNSDKIWKRFRAACDHFFNKKSEYFSNIDEVEKENLEEKKKLISEIENYEFVDNNNEENLATIKDYQRRWMEIGHVPIKQKDEVQKQFREAIDKQMEKLNMGKVQKSTLKYKTKIDKFKDSPNSDKIIRKERSIVSNRLNKLQNDIKLWENNIGFLADSKNANVLKQEFEKKIEDAKQETVILEEKLKALNRAERD